MATLHLDTAIDTPHSPTSHARSSPSDSDNEDNLPYPGELSRNDFLADDFDSQTYLSTLRNRHQTLEDLRSDLRQRSQLLNQELLDLVNNNYEEFLSLGADLKGGEEKVEGVRVGLLGFEREIEGIRKVVAERAEQVGQLLGERKEVRRDIMVGRGLLEVERRLEELEGSLGIKSAVQDAESLASDSDDEEEDTGVEAFPIRKSKAQTEQFVLLSKLVTRLGPEHPFLQAQQSRIEQVHRALLSSLATLLKQAKAAKDQDAILAIVRLYVLLDAEQDGAKTLQSG